MVKCHQTNLQYHRHLGYTPSMFTQIPRHAVAKFNSPLFLWHPPPPQPETLKFLQQEVWQFRISGATLMTGREQYQACISYFTISVCIWNLEPSQSVKHSINLSCTEIFNLGITENVSKEKKLRLISTSIWNSREWLFNLSEPELFFLILARPV